MAFVVSPSPSGNSLRDQSEFFWPHFTVIDEVCVGIRHTQDSHCNRGTFVRCSYARDYRGTIGCGGDNNLCRRCPNRASSKCAGMVTFLATPIKRAIKSRMTVSAAITRPRKMASFIDKKKINPTCDMKTKASSLTVISEAGGRERRHLDLSACASRQERAQLCVDSVGPW